MPGTPKTHDAVLADWRENAQQHDNDNYMFLHRLKCVDDKKVDRAAHALHREAFSIVECTKCANCCRTQQSVFTESDIDRAASHLGMPRDAFVAAYLEAEPDKGAEGYLTKTLPCPLLGDDNRCTIYDARPETCRGYPYTDKPGFVFRTKSVASNALVCPAVFYLVEQMKKRRIR